MSLLDSLIYQMISLFTYFIRLRGHYYHFGNLVIHIHSVIIVAIFNSVLEIKGAGKQLCTAGKLLCIHTVSNKYTRTFH